MTDGPKNIWFSKYEILSLVGSGTFADVYRVREIGTDAIFAIKMLHQSLSNQTLREAAILRKLIHPNIVALYNYEIEAKRVAYVMEYMDGGDLKSSLTLGQNMEPALALTIMVEICNAVAYAHEKSIIHRDIKPSNILLKKTGEIKVGDFGVAKMFDQESSHQTSVGTPYYMAPEQFSGKYDYSVDVYALGCVLYHMLCGEPPFVGTIAEVLRQHSENKPNFPDYLPQKLTGLLDQCLSKKAVDRPHNAGVLLRKIEGISSELDSTVSIEQWVSETTSKSQSTTDTKNISPLYQEFQLGDSLDLPTTQSIPSLKNGKEKKSSRKRSPRIMVLLVSLIAAAITLSIAMIFLPTYLAFKKLEGNVKEDIGTMVTIPNGIFTMGGCPSGHPACREDQLPEHKVHISSFYIHKYEVTVAQFKKCVESGHCITDGFGNYHADDNRLKNCNFDRADRGYHPMNCMDWIAARRYCEWIGGRLPTEAEWEYAAKGGKGERIYPWGDEKPSCEYAVINKPWMTIVNKNGCLMGSTWPVGSKINGVNEFGLYDMAGNVWEFVSDWYSENSYSAITVKNPKGPDNGIYRVARGAAFDSKAEMTTTFYRNKYREDQHDPVLGFRCVLDRNDQEMPPQINESIPTQSAQVYKDIVRINPGVFIMGGDSIGETNPDSYRVKAHRVELTRPYFIDATEVTVGEFREFIDATGYRTYAENGKGCRIIKEDGNIFDSKEASWRNPNFKQTEHHPVTCTVRYDVVEYANWKSEQESLEKCYSGKGKKLRWNRDCNGYRLPTEAEWEYAARAGVQSPFPCGDSERCLGTVAWYKGNSNNSSHQAGQKDSNAWGLFDMLGNVGEMVWDNWSFAKDSKFAIDPVGPYEGITKVLKGGDWMDSFDGCKLSSRSGLPPHLPIAWIGFRLARSVGKDESANKEFIPPATFVFKRSRSLSANIPEGMVLVPNGAFWMGCTKNDNLCDKDERPQHRVSLREFYLDKHEVSVDEFRQFVKSTEYKTDAERSGWCWSSAKTPWKRKSDLYWNDMNMNRNGNLPVTCVSWNDANAFCEWAGKRLPTEAEWEYAARAGTTTRYFAGDYGDLGCERKNPQLHPFAWYCANSDKMPHPIGQKKPNPWGIFDITGNVWEWVADWYDAKYYHRSPIRNPFCNSNCRYRILRGGGFFSNGFHLGLSNRMPYRFDNRADFIGFRCARDLNESASKEASVSKKD